ncbi:hypothetical protein QVD17_19947 [Tagetes erecta]|uniref:Uncharacterized protein n=1 Tax=Tagetes erecta TaxID=13708 RepID=A0AAD8KKU7_TARER|nr:hypothetical protein QVD17_19947 [Tagetes erecta]
MKEMDDNEDECNYDEDDSRYEDDVFENDDVEIAHGEDVGIDDVGFEDASFEDTCGKDDGGGERPWIRRVGDKIESIKNARNDGNVIGFKEKRFDIICNYPPKKIPLERWQRFCMAWDTEKWFKRSMAGSNNYKSDLSRHTGGSMGFDEHRIRLEKQKGGKVGFDLAFIDTHATKETKKRLRDGEITIQDLDELEFVTERSKDSHTLFQKELEKDYGPKNYENHDRDDEAVWKRMHLDSGRRLFGVQSVRLELDKERAARENLQNRLEQLEKNREEEREQARVEKEKERVEREKLQKQMDDILKRIG